MTTTNTSLEWKYGLRWVVGNAVAWAVALWLPLLIAEGSYYTVDSVGYVPAGLVIGAAQWLVLNAKFRHSVWWLLAYAVPWSLGLVLAVEDGFLTPNFWWFVGIGGLFTGAMQAWVLRHDLGQPVGWLFAYLLGSLVACYAGSLAGLSAYDLDVSETASYAIGGGVAGAVFGVCSGIVLLHLLPDQD